MRLKNLWFVSFPLRTTKIKNRIFSQLIKTYQNMEEIGRTNQIRGILVIGNVEDPTVLCLNSDVLFLADVFEKMFNVPYKHQGFNNLHCHAQPGSLWHCGLNETNKQAIAHCSKRNKRSIPNKLKNNCEEVSEVSSVIELLNLMTIRKNFMHKNCAK